MDFAGYFIKNRTSSWLFAAILLLGGIIAYSGLGRLEDPQFTLKQAMIITQYPGASPQQVEEEVSYPLENAIQQLPYVYHVTSVSTAGQSQIMVEMKDTYRARELKQIWDELRHKVTDLQGQLPPGVGTPAVRDDFGDVYGILYAITGDGFSDDELRDYVDFLRRELVILPAVGKVAVGGVQQEQVIVEMSRSRLTALGISPTIVANLLQSQNVVSNAGSIKVGAERIRIYPTGEFQQVSELESLIISNPAADELIYLGDIAKVYRAPTETPMQVIRHGGENALTLGISFTSGVNVVEAGEQIAARLEQLNYNRPLGIELHTIYNQPDEVANSVSGFIINLAEAVAIVIVVLLVFMGLRSGILIGLILLLTVLGTFIFMQQMQIELQRVSLGALIIALGMLVDNAIVITEGILIGIQRRLKLAEAASLIVKQTQWPLLGATVIAVTAFAPIGLSSDATGEFAGSLFWVLLVSLLLSWVTAITLTPFFASILFRTKSEPVSQAAEGDDELYKGIIFNVYRSILTTALKYRVATYLLTITLLVTSVLVFSKVKQVFFPPSNTPIFLLNLLQPAGTDVRYSVEQAEQVFPPYPFDRNRPIVEGGTVEVVVRALGGKVRVAVVDHGPGIPAAFRSRIFEKFSQADASDTRQKGGTGLGLAITRELCDQVHLLDEASIARGIRHAYREERLVVEGAAAVGIAALLDGGFHAQVSVFQLGNVGGTGFFGGHAHGSGLHHAAAYGRDAARCGRELWAAAGNRQP